MAMTQTTTFADTADDRLVTITDLRYELERERQITLAHFDRIDQRFLDLTASFDARFEQVDKRFEQVDKRFLDLIASFDARFEQVDKRLEQIDARFEQIDARFELVDKRFDQLDRRFDLLDERLRFNKTLVVASLSALASTASVILTLLK
jgi:predicted nuclease with TOPRIM domain